MPEQTLAQRVRAKYPGAYDDLSDEQLETSVRKKYPGVYDDIPTTTQPTAGGDAQFNAWTQRMGIKDVDSPYYDYRAAFQANASPDASGHWPSSFKKPGHPNEIVGGFNTRTGERVPGTTRAGYEELVAKGWEPETAKRLAAMPEPGQESMWDRAVGMVTGAADVVIPTALRVAGGVGGTIAGAAGGALFGGVGAVPGAVVGGGAGSALGETLAEGYEMLRGKREQLNPTSIAVEGALGAIPFVGKAGSLAKTAAMRAGQGTLLGGGGSAASAWAEGQEINPMTVARDAAIGTVLGAGAGSLEARAANRVRTPIVDNPPAKVVNPPANVDKVDVPPGESVQPALPFTNTEQSKVSNTRPPAGAVPPPKAIEPSKLVETDMVKNMPEEHRDGILKVIADNGGFEAQRRGVQPMERTQALADYVTVERAKTLPKGTALNAEQTIAYRNAAANAELEVNELAAKVASNQAAPWDYVRLQKARQEQIVITASWLGARAEAGRALNAHKPLANALRSQDEKAIAEAMKNPKWKEDIEGFAAEWAKLGDDPVVKLRFLRDRQAHTVGDMARGAFYGSILSGPKTHVRNILGNSTNLLFTNVAARPAAAMADALRSKWTGAERTVFLSEFKPAVVGTVMGLKQGVSDFMFTVKNGFGRVALDTFDVPRPELPGGGVNPLNWAGRLLEGEDQFFRSIAYHQELYSRAYAAARQEAVQKGLTERKAMDAHILSRMSEWTINPPKNVEDAAQTAAKRAVFKEDPGVIVQRIQLLKHSVPALDFIVPFVRTPAAIIRQGVESTPLAYAMPSIREKLAAGGREAAEIHGRVVAGSAAMTSLAILAAEGRISGPGPSNANERAALMEQGWRPNSIKMGDTWVDYTQLQPLAQPLYAVASGFEEWKRTGQFDPMRVAIGAGAAILDQSFLSGVQDLNNALSDPDRYYESWKERMATSAVPMSGLLRNVAQTVDPVARDPQGTAEAVKSVIPGLSTTVQPKLTRFGEPVTRPGTAAERGFSPVTRSPESKDPVINELRRLNVTNIGQVPKELGATQNPPMPKIVLSIEERQQIGRAQRKALEDLMAGPTWKNLDDQSARMQIERVIGNARAIAMRQIRASHAKSVREVAR